ncbi:lamina-associated polypeptide 2, isoforms alpha/zeta-like [Bufo gargarizans]|uniref:lamina-associated polypeptide 2, isoforms alpha/zeta-like n=1 Tax=Bufo gargarizans TaxID=30331 RepID=UPI001CF1C916|nr:lamina-associated polypeptide 2, isoforms alpha/zeta-like [Bufo gargarizans]
MDKRADAYLRKNWEASTSAFKPNIATTSVARSLKLWLEELESHIENKTPRDQLLEAIPTMSSAVDFISDASADALRLSAREAALSNSARRSLWLKGRKGDVASKSKLCALPCQGGFLFGSALDDILDKASDKKKGFPAPSFPKQGKPFRSNERRKAFGDQKKRREWRSDKSKSVLFKSRPQTSSSTQQ